MRCKGTEKKIVINITIIPSKNLETFLKLNIILIL